MQSDCRASNARNALLPLLAAGSMLIDHAGAMLFPHLIWLRILGRISFPLFAYGIAVGVMQTSNIWKYVGRILLVAVLSQPIAIWALEYGSRFNPLFTLAYGAVVLHVLQTRPMWMASILILGSFWLPADYGAYGVGMIVCFGQFQTQPKQAMLWLMGLQLVYSHTTGNWIQAYALVAVVFIWLQNWCHIPFPKQARYAWYMFYPAHLLALGWIRDGLF